ncbi:putative transcription factor C2H2 family [Helianthus annuus]|uniref:RING-type E3 ubiquitin transferase n=1 Tax=Helianthus annuus TaxID=4232 RepID=A0A251UY62_HELAN|nr:putative RING-H2 finger protein ATL53 [Helianthus annuus]KAF5809778.1 putative transcription factor C2H2 family [Helianthus annuus]KAJ0580747.1 putative transcription factor C2H2 family [Helianthus annuus]KAJ0588420.1 putative transcription factor C2H2 family [Helianthus annuus]KAJ0596695.1 putative transcription factor C2H2 family [Helianthus annuus]KAJ0757367.1 putative transcription factor C2H2 family [Helianthus annuus]
MAPSPVGSPNPQPSHWSPLVLAIVGTMGTLFLVFSYFNILRHCSFRSILPTRNRQRRLLRDTDVNDPSLHFQSRGLDSFIVKMIPVTQFIRKSESDKGKSTECAICLGEYEDDEWVKTIPTCSHVFHVSCIDTWFQSHSSCPLCRSDVVDLEVSVSICESLGENHVREDVVEERSVFYQAIRSHILQNANFSRLES